MKVALWVVSAIVVGVAMEPWAALLHGRVWHALLWRVHRSHHVRRRGAWEANDWLSVLHAPIAIALVLYGCRGPIGVVREIAFGAGLGMTLFGIAYVVVHDGLVHGRLPVARLGRWRWLARVRHAHLVHHRSASAPYGLFAGPWERARFERRSAHRVTLRSRGTRDARPSV